MSASDLNIRKALREDVALIQELARDSWAFAYKDILSIDQIEYMLELMYGKEALKVQFDNPLYHYYIAENAKGTVGFLGFEHEVEPETTKLHRIYLLNEEKGKGYGKELLRFLEAQTLKYGDTRIILNVNKNNDAKKVYEKSGFLVYGEGVFDIGQGYSMDDFLMEKFLIIRKK